MNDPLTGESQRRDPFGNGQNQEYCSDCRNVIPAGSPFCPHCGPPGDPEEEQRDDGMSFWQAGFRIFLIVLVFGGVALYKMDFTLDSPEEEEMPGIPMESDVVHKEGKPHTVDYKTIHNIKTIKAQMREKPEDNAKLVVTLKKGTQVTIVDGNEEWWKISAAGQTGWVPKASLDSEVR